MAPRCVSLSLRTGVLVLAFLLSTQAVSAQPTVTVSGVVTDGSAPIAAVGVEFYDMTQVLRANASTDAQGRYAVQLAPGDYRIAAVPPPGLGLAPVNLPYRFIDANTTIDIVMVAPVRRTITGRVLDASAAGIAGATINLTGSTGFFTTYSTTTDASGGYRLEVPAGTYRLEMTSSNGQLEPGRPQFVRATIWQVPLDGDRVLDLPLPLHRVDVHVQNGAGVAAAHVGLSATGMDACGFDFSGLNACVSSGYSFSTMPPMPGMPPIVNPETDAAGNFAMWLTATGAVGPATPGYTITATPPAESGLPSTAVTGITVSGPASVTITLRASVTLAGRVLDSLGMPIAGATITLASSQPGLPGLSTTTGADGSYRFDAAPGTYRFEMTSYNGSLSPGRPQFLRAMIWQVPLEVSRALDIVVPLSRVDVHVQDDTGNAVAGVGLTVTGYDNCQVEAAGLPMCVSSGYSYSLMPPMPPPPGMPEPPEVPQPVTDANGDFSMWLTPTGVVGPATPAYTFTATPPAGSTAPATLVPGVVVSGDMPLTITLRAAVRLSGRITDAAGAPIAGATLNLTTSIGGGMTTPAMTDADGIYRFEVAAGAYRMEMTAYNTLLEPNRAQFVRLMMWDLPLNATRTLDLALPFTPVQIHAQDVAGRPVAGIGLSMFGGESCEFEYDGLRACISSSYFYSTMPPMPGMPPPPLPPQPMTDASGNFMMWLVPNSTIGPATPGYVLNATPAAGIPFRPFSLSGIRIVEPTQIAISMQFVHDSPVTSASLSPAPGSSGEYPDPVTITLSSSAASGYVIDRIEYQLDGGPVQTYAGAFTISGGGTHEVRFWATDDGGVYEAPKSVTFAIRSVPTLPEIQETLAGFCASGDIDNAGVCHSLAVKLRDGHQLDAFLHELSAQRGKHVSEEAYARLADDVRKLMQQ